MGVSGRAHAHWDCPGVALTHRVLRVGFYLFFQPTAGLALLPAGSSLSFRGTWGGVRVHQVTVCSWGAAVCSVQVGSHTGACACRCGVCG